VSRDILLKNRDGSALSSFLAEILPYFILVLLATAAFGNALGGYFLCDDLFHQTYLWRAFNQDGGLLLSPFYSTWLKDTTFFVFYRPLTELSFACDYLLYGSRPLGYHLTSFLWHLVNACLLFALLKILMIVPGFYIAGARQRILIAFFCAAIWAVYPIHSETISWISARSDLMATAFNFATMVLFAATLTGKSKIPKALVPLPMVLGFLTKELTISLPFVLFSLYFLSSKNAGPAAWRKSLLGAWKETKIYFLLLIVYLVGRWLALGDFVGGYLGSVGSGLNESLLERWLLSQSFYKIFHPFNNQLIAADSPLKLTFRIVWGLCGVFSVVWARLAGAIAGKYRLMLFALAWLFFSLAPNFQIWSFSETMSGGRIAYLPTAPIVILIVFAVYPLGVWSVSQKAVLALKLAGYATLIALIAASAITSAVNDMAWLEASAMVRIVRGQLNDLTDNLADGQRLVIINLPTMVKGAYAFTSPGMVESLLNFPMRFGDDSKKVVVLDAEPCSYPRVNFHDVKAAASAANKAIFQLYYYDKKLGCLKKADEKDFFDQAQSPAALVIKPEDSAAPIKADISSLKSSNGAVSNQTLAAKTAKTATAQQPVCINDFHEHFEDGENYRFKMTPAVNPTQFEFARLTVTLSADARVEKLFKPAGATQLLYLWNNCPDDDTGEKDPFSGRLIELPPPGQSAKYFLPLGQNKRWILSKNVDQMQIFIGGLKDGKATLSLEFLPGTGIHPSFNGTVSGASAGDNLLSLKRLSRKAQETLDLHFDASKITGARKVVIEILPPYNYFHHLTRHASSPAILDKHLKLIDTGVTSGKLSLKANDFPQKAVYQMRACALDGEGKILGDTSPPLTVTVTD
jgi:hypothetical protein